MAWLLSANERRIPQILKPKALELRRALSEGEIKRLEMLYVHNGFESKNVEEELKAVAEATKTKLGGLGFADVVVSQREFGLRGIEELYRKEKGVTH